MKRSLSAGRTDKRRHPIQVSQSTHQELLTNSALTRYSIKDLVAMLVERYMRDLVIDIFTEAEENLDRRLDRDGKTLHGH